MIVESISLKKIRCFEEKNISFDPGLNIIFGPNASGKTSILESIYVVGLTKSYRCNDLRELIKHDNDYFFVNCKIKENGIVQQASIALDSKGKKIKINDFVYKRTTDYIGFLNVVVFSASDFLILQGSSKDRRSLFDSIFCQISKEYLTLCNYYKKLLKERNALLKRLFYENSQSLRKLNETISKQLSYYGQEISKKRDSFLKEIVQICNKIHAKISSENEILDIKYIKSVNNERFERELIDKIDDDIKRGFTNIGPHRDDYQFVINGNDASKYASQGQQRSVLLSTKLALAEFIYKKKGKTPIVLLDDLFSELDKKRQNMVLQTLNSNFQTIITTATLSDLDENILSLANIIEI